MGRDRRRERLCIVMPTHWEVKMGGSQYQAKLLTQHLLAAARYEIYFVGRHVPQNNAMGGCHLVRLARPANGRRPLFFDAVRLYRTLADIRPDVIYQHVGCSYTGVSARYAERHGCRMLWRISSDRNVTPLYWRQWRRFAEPIERKLLDYGIAHAPLIVAQTQMQDGLLQRHYGRRATAVVRNFHPDPEEPIDKSGTLQVVWIGNFKRVKQPELFIKLARALRSVNAGFIMVGQRPADRVWGAELDREIAKSPNLRYLGPGSQEEVNQLLARSHLLVNTSRYEGMPNTFIQAWMRGVVVVSLNVDPDGVLGPGRIGRVSGHFERLVTDTRDFLEGERLRRECAERARHHAREFYSMRNAETLARLLDTEG